MTLEELRKRCEENNIQYSYGPFLKPVEPPHLVAIESETNNYMADNKVYLRIGEIQLDLTMNYLDFDLMKTIEEKILFDVCWNKTEETYLSKEEIWQVSYFFEI